MIDSMRGELVDARIKLRHLVCFLEVARLKSVVQAASVLGLSQPAASKTIQELETILGVELFDRSRRNLILTAYGDVFQRYVGASLTSLKQGVRSVVQPDSTVAFTIGALPTVSASILPSAVLHFSAQRLGMKPRIITGPNAFLMSQLRVGDVDLVIGRMAEPETMRGFAFEHLYSEAIALIVRPGHPLLGGPGFDIGAISGFQMLMPPPGSIIRPIVDRFLVAHAVGPLVAGEIETVSDAFARSYVRASDAVWIISKGVVIEDVTHGFLAMLPADTSDTQGPVGLTTRADVPPTLPVQLFVQSVRAVLAGRAGSV
ncbi:LysR family transcriptional regulator, pca operon transcriptional activator [Kaistia soli DSM 19436]|uniref:LysR family transcriptional regulator, pca operon transcriptional activator n=1 Tax=Kaistia soli DSM 19436 TaxID=1122133 RepID=A0A1M5KKF0_9HYPH|nr:pca operon transcription factor PcaQ [Kaistia soli]SHG53195.1 LysR family transcriptional regulator, pca operon transcriptional activator [Kaistia soli DSM 19436]